MEAAWAERQAPILSAATISTCLVATMLEAALRELLALRAAMEDLAEEEGLHQLTSRKMPVTAGLAAEAEAPW